MYMPASYDVPSPNWSIAACSCYSMCLIYSILMLLANPTPAAAPAPTLSHPQATDCSHPSCCSCSYSHLSSSSWLIPPKLLLLLLLSLLLKLLTNPTSAAAPALTRLSSCYSCSCFISVILLPAPSHPLLLLMRYPAATLAPTLNLATTIFLYYSIS